MTAGDFAGAAIPSIGTLLGVWAHPDDEAYLSSALMALVRQHGQRVAVLTATDGDAGETAFGPNAPRVAALRRSELAASLDVVGVREHYRLGLGDGRCDRVPDALGAALVGELIDSVCPDTIATFGPEGMTGHADHRAVSRWVTAAWSERRQGRLWYATLTPGFHQRWGELNRKMSIFLSDARPPETPDGDLAFAICCRGALLRTKMGALRSHASQVEPLITAVGEATFAQWWAQEVFVDASRLDQVAAA